MINFSGPKLVNVNDKYYNLNNLTLIKPTHFQMNESMLCFDYCGNPVEEIVKDPPNEIAQKLNIYSQETDVNNIEEENIPAFNKIG